MTTQDNDLTTLKVGDLVWVINSFNHGEERTIEKITPTGRFTLSCGRVFNSDGTKRGNGSNNIRIYHPDSKRVAVFKDRHLQTSLLRDIKKLLDGFSPNVTVDQLERILVILREGSAQ